MTEEEKLNIELDVYSKSIKEVMAIINGHLDNGINSVLSLVHLVNEKDLRNAIKNIQHGEKGRYSD
jgi:hypothetical protein